MSAATKPADVRDVRREQCDTSYRMSAKNGVPVPHWSNPALAGALLSEMSAESAARKLRATADLIDAIAEALPPDDARFYAQKKAPF